MQTINIQAAYILTPDKYLNFSVTIPDQCPHCNKGIHPHMLHAYFDDSIPPNIYSSFICPTCQKLFMVQFSFYKPGSNSYIVEILPHPNTQKTFSKNIAELSPSFVKIYNQAESAENANLDEICGQGYRKSLEFLVKDYAIKFHPNDVENIQKILLSPCIEQYIENSRIKSLAKASAWLGNDETHYTRKHENYNIEHLKSFINAMVSYVDSELTFLESEQLLSSK